SVKPMGRLAGKVALITGGARGQGRAIAEKFASEGADIAISDICEKVPGMQYPGASTEDLDTTRKLVEKQGRKCVTAVADVRELDAMQRFADAVVEEFGKIDIL